MIVVVYGSRGGLPPPWTVRTPPKTAFGDTDGYVAGVRLRAAAPTYFRPLAERPFVAVRIAEGGSRGGSGGAGAPPGSGIGSDFIDNYSETR